MQKNLVWAVILSAIVYIGWFSYMDKKMAPQRAAALQARQAAIAAQKAELSGKQQNSAVSKSEKTQASSHIPSIPAEAKTVYPSASNDWKKKAVSVSAGKAEYSFDSETASIRSMVYQGPVEAVDLIPEKSAGFFLLSDNHGSPYSFEKTENKQGKITFTAKTGSFLITKTFEFAENNGLNNIKFTFKNRSRADATVPALNIVLGPGLNTVKSELKENKSLWRSIYAHNDGSRKYPKVEKLKNESAKEPPSWAGLDNRYFLVALVDGSLKDTRPYGTEEKINGDKTPGMLIPIGNVSLVPGGEYVFESQFYFGPKDYKFLKTEAGHGLHLAVDFGFFAPIAKIADSLLGYFYKLTGNYGVAIIIISILVQILLSPFTFKSYKSMALMTKMQPEMKSIQERYKDNPQKMQMEMLALYKRYGTNPFSSCVPMLFQIPVFFALFTALRNSWALHGAPFIFWIQDLSAKDPYYVLPIIMGAIMFFQQKMSPQSAANPEQAKMMQWMPIIFTFMFLAFPSGLVIYWLINSIWSFAQNMYLKKKMA
ncbi:MAG: membrane protein insertase YidC [Elusimicrobiales bacterium]|nr:membrane protein insertase YidC [Elusimicrobiales bacterium]